MSNQHEKSEPEPEEETNPLIQALRGAKGERRQEIHRLKKQLEQDLQKKIMEYIEVLGISKSVADAARLGKTSVKIDIREAENHFHRYYNTTDVFNFVENKSMQLRFEKKWTEFFHQFKKTIAVDDLKESCLTQQCQASSRFGSASVEVVWPELTHDSVGAEAGNVFRFHEFDEQPLTYGDCRVCKTKERNVCHKQEYRYPDFLIVKWK